MPVSILFMFSGENGVPALVIESGALTKMTESAVSSYLINLSRLSPARDSQIVFWYGMGRVYHPKTAGTLIGIKQIDLRGLMGYNDRAEENNEKDFYPAGFGFCSGLVR